jgi:hypothetical protein
MDSSQEIKQMLHIEISPDLAWAEYEEKVNFFDCGNLFKKTLMPYLKVIQRSQNKGGSTFEGSLIRLISCADTENFEKLKVIYPYECLAFKIFSRMTSSCQNELLEYYF